LAKIIEEDIVCVRKTKNEVKFNILWETNHRREQMRRIHNHVTAPKRALPSHAESYNPPSAYLFDEKEM
jgi:ribosome biogenesis protein ERB1